MSERPPTLDEVAALARGGEPPRLAVFVPLEAAVPAAQQNEVRLRHALERLGKRLAELGVEDARAAALLDSFQPLRGDARPLPPGLHTRAAVLHEGTLRTWALPDREEERAHVGHSLPLRPLLRAARRHRPFRVLAISAKHVTLYDGDLLGLRPRHEPGLPSSLEDALGPEVQGEGVQFHSTSPGGTDPIYHGHGGAAAERRVDLERFHRALADAALRVLRGRPDPIVLAADQVHLARLRERLAALPLAEEGVEGNPDSLAATDLHRRALQVIERSVAAELERARAELGRARGRGKAALGLEATLTAVATRRVRRLFVPAAARMPGRVDADALRAVPAWGDEDVCDELATLALQAGAEVVALEPGQAPAPDAEIAAELH